MGCTTYLLNGGTLKNLIQVKDLYIRTYIYILDCPDGISLGLNHAPLLEEMGRVLLLFLRDENSGSSDWVICKRWVMMKNIPKNQCRKREGGNMNLRTMVVVSWAAQWLVHFMLFLFSWCVAISSHHFTWYHGNLRCLINATHSQKISPWWQIHVDKACHIPQNWPVFKPPPLKYKGCLVYQQYGVHIALYHRPGFRRTTALALAEAQDVEKIGKKFGCFAS